MKSISTRLLVAALLMPLGAAAYEQGDTLLRVGATTVQPHDGYKPDNVRVGNDTQLGLNIVYMVADNVGLELLLATPFEHDIKLKGVGVVGSTKHLPPTLSVQYYFANSSPLTPYLGIGLNYTDFFDENLDAVGYDNIELEKSTGFALQLGADFAINQHWGVNLDVRWVDIDTRVTDTPAGDPAGVKGIDVKVDPLVYSLTALYKF